MRQRTRITSANIDVFLRRFAKGINQDKLTPIPTGPFGASFVFQYGTDSILKVNKVNQRETLLKEAMLLSYLSKQALPVEIPAPIEVHPNGFYAVYPKISGESLTAEVVSSFSHSEMEALTRAVGEFLSYLHGTDFPEEIEEMVPRGERDLEGMCTHALTWIDFIEEHAVSQDTNQFRIQVESFRGVFTQRWATNHGDLSLGNIMRVEGSSPRFSIIDFTDAEECDPSMEFEIFKDDLDDEGLDATQILSSVLRHYESTGDDVERKLEFRALLGEIHTVFRHVRAEVRRAERGSVGRN